MKRKRIFPRGCDQTLSAPTSRPPCPLPIRGRARRTGRNAGRGARCAAAVRLVPSARRSAVRLRLRDRRAPFAAPPRAACLPAFRPPSTVFSYFPVRAHGPLRGLVVRAARRRFARRAPLRRSPPCGRLRRAASAPFMLLPRDGSVGASGTSLAHGPAGGGVPRPHRAGRRPAAAPPLALRRSPHGARPARADRAPPPSSP